MLKFPCCLLLLCLCPLCSFNCSLHCLDSLLVSVLFLLTQLQCFMSLLWKILYKNNSTEQSYWNTKRQPLFFSCIETAFIEWIHTQSAVWMLSCMPQAPLVHICSVCCLDRSPFLCPLRKMTFGKVNEMGQFIREAEPEPDVKKSKGTIHSHLSLSLLYLHLSHYSLCSFALTLSYFISALLAVKNVSSLPTNINLL